MIIIILIIILIIIKTIILKIKIIIKMIIIFIRYSAFPPIMFKSTLKIVIGQQFMVHTKWAQLLPECYMNVLFWSE